MIIIMNLALCSWKIPQKNRKARGKNAEFSFKKWELDRAKRRSWMVISPECPSPICSSCSSWTIGLVPCRVGLPEGNLNQQFLQGVINHEWFLCSCIGTNWNRVCRAARCFNQKSDGWLGWTIFLDVFHHSWESKIAVVFAAWVGGFSSRATGTQRCSAIHGVNARSMGVACKLRWNGSILLRSGPKDFQSSMEFAWHTSVPTWGRAWRIPMLKLEYAN